MHNYGKDRVIDMTKFSGYMGKILRLNMTTHTASELVLDDDTIKNYFGGLALGAKLLYDLVPPRANELGLENKLILTTSPVTGTSAPGAAMVNVTTKGPLINGVSCSQMNGHLGRYIKASGYDGVIIEGMSDTWQYVSVINGKVEFKNADGLLGKDTFVTEDYLKEMLGQPKSGVFCIGPAGENLVRFAAVEADKGHFASTGGSGAVMGSKKLKAILFAGDARPSVANPTAFKEALRPWLDAITALPETQGLKHCGTLSTFTPLYKMGMVPVKNLMTGEFAEAPDYDGMAIHSRNDVRFKKTSCYACPIAHCNEMEITEGKHKGYVGDEAEYEGLAIFGPNILVKDPLDSMYLSSINDRMGMDLKECGFLVSWAMECYEKGYLTIEDTEGLELTWGNVDAVETILKKIAKREGKFADLLAEGVMRASLKVGGEAAKCAVYTKRHAPHAHDARVGLVLTQAVSDMGSMHGGNPMKPEPACGVMEPINPREMGKWAWGMAMNSKRTMWRDSMLVCMFTEKAATTDQLVAVANAVTGIGYTSEEAMAVGERVNQIMRTYNLLSGLDTDDDTASYRLLYDAPTSGPVKDFEIAWTYDMMKRMYYHGMGWDMETSKPLPETLKRVGLDELIPLLWKG